MYQSTIAPPPTGEAPAKPSGICNLLAVVSIAAACFWSGGAVARSLPDFTELVERNRAAVVNISTTQRRTAPVERPRMPKGFEIPDLPEDSPFHEFFRRFFGEGEIEEFDAQSLGRCGGKVLDEFSSG